MKPGQSPTGERFAPPPPPRQPRYPTAPRPTSYAPRSAGPPPTPAPRPQKSWDEFNNAGRFTSGTEPSLGFPGMSRTQTTRKKQGFTTTAPRGDEPAAPKSSAYASWSRGERPQAATPQTYFPESSTHPSPQLTPQRPGRSPLRHARSSPGIEEEGRPQRPGLERIPSRYSGIGGERTDLTGGGNGRSSSVRNSPIDSRLHDHERNGPHLSFAHDLPSRHRSSSPKSRPPPVHVDSSSDSETSSDEDVEEQRWASRPKTVPRPTRPNDGLPAFSRRASADGQAFTGQFPGTQYVKPPTPREADNGQNQYRPPPPPRNQPTSQAAFNYVPGYYESRPVAQKHIPSVGNGYAGPGAPNNGPNMYAPFHSYPREWSKTFRSSPLRVGKTVPSLNGFPSWAVPSSVLPPKNTPKKHTLDSIREEKRDRIENWRSDGSRSTFIERPRRPRKHGRFADPALSDSSYSDTDAPNPRTQPSFQSASHEDVSKKFSASEWNDKFVGAEGLFRPTSAEMRGQRSPTRPARTRAKSYSKTQTSPIKEASNEFPTSVNGEAGETTTTSEAFVPGKFSAEAWAEKLRYQATANANEDQTKTPKRVTKAPTLKRPPTYPKPGSPSAEKGAPGTPVDGAAGPGQKADDDVDPMDIDDSFPNGIPSMPPEVRTATGPLQTTAKEEGPSSATETPGPQPSLAPTTGVDLNDLANIAPLKPSDTGLGDLKDLNSTLPFESKASPARPSQTVTNGFAVSSLKTLNLPKPPKNIIPPLENVTPETWARYMTEMSAYMHDWHIFDKKMLDHFQARQVQLDMTLMSNWMSALGDGPNGEEISRKIQEGSSTSGNQKAGYAAYRQWMEEDMRVREWWDVACERHRQAVIDLGKVREMAKPLAVI